ncbi:MAG: threonine synthase [Oscillospiraceae bacterium]|nr:threonine synthase [Oscillospiraceae bacterium]
MLYQSTRGDNSKVASAEAIAHGLADDGGLFVPESFPKLTLGRIAELTTEPYYKRAAYIMGLFLKDFSKEVINSYSKAAYSIEGVNHFYNDKIAPLKKLDKSTHFLELWHGPTCAFKDMALQVMPGLLTASLRKTGEAKDVCVLVATSGDTGKAALEGFRDVAGTSVIVFYPRDGVSEVQKLQMTSQSGSNVNVIAVAGNFDDAQTGVKAIFQDVDLSNELGKTGYILSSANSINWGRLVPQIVYYISAYCDLFKSGEIELGDKINFCVPTGNFGNILSAYYAEKMGLPINKLICASNRNDVLTQFINTGVYDRNRPFFATVSPSMDILVSSNLERLLFELSDRNGDIVSAYMKDLSYKGLYTIPSSVRNELNRVFDSGFCSEEDTMETIKETFENSDYLIDTHTAVAYKVLNDYREKTNDKSISVVVSTASPFKFCEAVLEALGQPKSGSGVTLIEKLSDVTGNVVPMPLISLENAIPRFKNSVAVSGMKASVLDFIKER